MLNSLENRLKSEFLDDFFSENETWFIKESDHLFNNIEKLKLNFGFIQLVGIFDLSQNKVLIQLSNLEFHKRINIFTSEISIKEKRLHSLFPFIDWHSRKKLDENAVVDSYNSPFARDYQCSEVEELNREYVYFGGVNPLSLNIAKFAMELDGDIIRRLKIIPGLHSIGIEKSLINRNYLQLAPILENYFSPSSIEYAFLINGALESIHDMDISLRAKAIRMVVLELARIGGHLANLERLFAVLNLSFESHQAFGLKNSVHALFGEFNNSQYGEGIIKFGGVSSEVPVGWIATCLNTLSDLHKKVNKFKNHLMNSNYWMSKTDTFKVRAQDALLYGFSGPALRSTGVNYDLRKSSPTYLYDEVQFDIPLGIDGTNYDRFLVRVEEIHQSIKIILQILDNMPQGDILVGPLQEWSSLKKGGQREEFIKSVSEGIKMKQGTHYFSFESTNGELGLMLETNSSGKGPLSLAIKTPGASFLCGLESILVGSSYCDIPGSLASFGIEGKEVDK